MIDWARLRELYGDLGGDDFFMVLELFLDEVESGLYRLSLDDPAALGRQFHGLKGSGLNLGFRDFAALCEAGERLATAGTADQATVSAVIDLYAASKQQMQAAMGQELGLAPLVAVK
ncbi:MAG: Hpt domain-containing protein [Paracoccus sp. (in: a-proteobacteria)]|uniref:Hpt domain-containing protein n=1 Tax=Paracoccus sp. TaxID=267 RepID=UPI0026E0F312|nr:Hpt domain-containing protein [Paracoccus sp. (in: a-proteobacteria)]MDO5621793.1 Hpt domain-containing protein [Paracoccus sp. (in: a-proteobacteria)]